MSNEHYYAASELAGLPGMPGTVRSVQRAAKNWPFRKRAGKGGGREYPESALPKETRQALVKQRIDALSETCETGTEPVKSGQTGTALAVREPLSWFDLTDRQRNVADARAAVLAEVSRYVENGKICQTEAVRTLLSNARLGKTTPYLINALHTGNDKRDGLPSTRTVLRWLHDAKQSGGSLAPRGRRKDLTQPDWADLLLELYRRPQKPSLSQAWRDLKDVYEGTYPSYHAVYRWVMKLPLIELEKGRMGPRELKNIKPFVRRTFAELLPNDIWSADGHTFDAEVSHPMHGRPFRPEITTIIDIGDRYVVGFSVGLAEAALATVDALRHAITNNGIPAIFYVDNGSGYANDMLKNEATGILGRFGIEVTHSLPYNSQARGVIERLQKSLWVAAAKQLDSYMGVDMDREAKQKFHKESRRGDTNGIVKLAVSWTNFIKACEDAIAAYNARPHTSLPKIDDPETGLRRHMSPAEYRKEKMAAEGYAHHEIKPEEADLLFRPREVRKVLRGEVSIFGNRYFSKDLAALHGEDVQVGYDVHDGQFVWIYDADGHFVCKAEFQANARKYMPTSMIDAAREKRSTARLKRNDAHREEIEAELHGGAALEAMPAETLPGTKGLAEKVEAQLNAVPEEQPEKPAVRGGKTFTEMAPTIPQDQHERYLFWREWHNKAQDGANIPEELRLFLDSFPKSSAYRAWNAFYNPDQQQEAK